MAKGIQTLTGFRDFVPEDCAVRNYLFETFREVARRYGFVEYETPILESLELYQKKTGDELTSQLFAFEDQSGRPVTMRPEVTASLARLVTAVQRQYQKPLRWFEIGQCFRYEAPQKGRLREFYQFNVDLIGESAPSADAELIALSIDVLRELGFTSDDFKVRLSDRNYWQAWAAAAGLAVNQLPALLEVVDKLERWDEAKVAAKLEPLGLTREQIEQAIHSPTSENETLDAVVTDLTARGLGDFVQVDHTIVRGLAYYTGVVFELFPEQVKMRAIAGGGRYDSLLTLFSDGTVDLPAAGFAIGDVVIRNLIEETPHALARMQEKLAVNQGVDLFLILADDSKKPEALALITQLRYAGVSVLSPLTSVKVGKQFKLAEQAGARFALVIGSEFPQIGLKHLATRQEESLSAENNAVDIILERLQTNAVAS